MIRKSTSHPHLLAAVTLIFVVGALACGGDQSSLGTNPPGGTQIDLSIGTAQSPDTIGEGATVTFTITAKNLGPVDATGVVAGDTLSSGLTYVSSNGSNQTVYSPTSHQWAIGALPVNAVRTLQIIATAKTGTANSWQTNNAGVLAAESDSVLGNNLGVDSVRISTAPPPPPPPPAGNGEPVDPGSGYLWTDSYDNYSSVASMLSSGSCGAGTDAYGLPNAFNTYGTRMTQPNFTNGCDIQNDADGLPIYVLITGRSGSGKALESNIAGSSGGTNQGANWNGPWSAADINNSPAKTVVIQHWFRGRTLNGTGGGPGSIGMKWIEIFGNNNGSNRNVDRLQFSTNGSGNSHWRVNDGPNTSGFARTLQPIGPYLDHADATNGFGKLMDDGQWHRITYLYKANTSSTYQHTGGTSPANETYSGTSSRDGRLAMWVDGHKVLDYSQATVGVTPPGGTGPWCYQSDVDWIPAKFYFQRIQYPGTNNDTRVSWIWNSDDLKVWEF